MIWRPAGQSIITAIQITLHLSHFEVYIMLKSMTKSHYTCSEGII